MSSTQIQPLTDRATLCRQRIKQTADIIKELSGQTPAGCKLTFSIKTSTIVGIDISEETEGDLLLALFIGWHDYYKKELRRITGRLNA
jgi:hypothetical protein